MLGNIKTLRQGKRQPDEAAPEFEVHPLVVSLKEHDIGIERGHGQTKDGPSIGQMPPNVFGQAEFAAQKQLQRVFAPKVQAQQQYQAEDDF